MKTDATRPERPAEPYSWKPEFVNEEMLDEWYGYIRALEDYTEHLEAISRRDEEIKAAPEPPKQEKLYEVCYHETLGKTLYIRASSEEEAKRKAEAYFEDYPLTYDDYVDWSMEAQEIDQKTSGIKDWEIIDTEDAE